MQATTDRSRPAKTLMSTESVTKHGRALGRLLIRPVRMKFVGSSCMQTMQTEGNDLDQETGRRFKLQG